MVFVREMDVEWAYRKPWWNYGLFYVVVLASGYCMFSYVFCWAFYLLLFWKTFLYGLFCLLLMGGLYVMGLTAYLKCVFTSPGYVRGDEFGFSVTSDIVEAYKELDFRKMKIKLPQNMKEHDLIERTSRGHYRVCTTCQVIKPDRTHHCSTTGKCVLKFDHFCPWVCNTIGYYNYKYFILFLTYLWIGAHACCITMLPLGYELFEQVIKNDTPPTVRQFNLIWVFFLSFFFGLSIMAFSFYHYKLLACNQTTVESLEKYEKYMKQHHSEYPYDLGYLRNIKSVMGEKISDWFSPWRKGVSGDGHFYPNLYTVVNESV